jgi:hypothetical protein
MRILTCCPEFIQVLLLLFGISAHPVTSLSLSPFSSVLSSTELPVNGSRHKLQAENEGPLLSSWSEKAGESALRQVTFLASKVAESTEKGGATTFKKDDNVNVAGTGGVVYNNANFNKGAQKTGSTADLLRPNLEVTPKSMREEQVWTALASLELDSKIRCWG